MSTYYIRELPNGNIRFGHESGLAFDFSYLHPEYEVIRTMPLRDAELMFDVYSLEYLPVGAGPSAKLCPFVDVPPARGEVRRRA